MKQNEGYKTASELIKKAFSSAIKPIVKMSVTEWAKKYRIISQGNAEPGKFKTDRAKYQNEPMDAFTQPGIHKVILMCASQSGKSSIMENVIGRFAQLDPCAIMLVEPSLDMAQDFSKTRIAPMIRDTKSLSAIFKNDGQARNGTSTILSKIFAGGRLIMCGSNSPAGLASRPVRILLCDEVDRFAESAGKEGSPIALAEKRMTTFWNHCEGLFSTPTIKGRNGGIEQYYLSGTQEEWQHECPNCHEYHLLEWQQMESDMEILEDDYKRKTFFIKSVVWRCPDCGKTFSEIEMRNAPQKYVPKNIKALENGVRSFKVNGFASPWVPWKTIALEMYQAEGDPELEKTVINTRLAESYEPKGAFSDEGFLMKRREEYNSDIPKGVLLLTCGVDTQDNRFEYEICGWGMDEECWGIQKGIILGQPDNPSTVAELESILDRPYYFADGTALKISRTFIDSGGHYTSAIYDICAKRGRKQTFAIKGMGGAGIPLINKIGVPKGYAIPLVMLGVDDGKQSIMDRLAIEVKGAKYFHFPNDENRGYTQTYFKGLISEQKVTVKRGGQIKSIWETIEVNGEKVRNEPLDLRVYNLAAMLSIKPDWTKLHDIINGEPIKKVQKEKKTNKKRPAQACSSVDFW